MLRANITSQLGKLGAREGGLLDLIGDPEWPKEKIAERLRNVRTERAKLERQLVAAEEPDLDAGQAALEMLLELLSQPRELYRLAGKRARQALNQAFFTKIYLDGDDNGPSWPPTNQPRRWPHS